MIGDSRGLLDCERLVVGKEGAGTGDVYLGVLVGAAANRVIGPLIQQRFAVQYELDARVLVFGVEAAQAFAGHNDRYRNVILHLHLVSWVKIGSQLVNAP